MLVLSACSRTGLDPGVADLKVGGGATDAGAVDDSAVQLGPTRRWIAVTTEDGSGSEQLYAVRFGADAIEDVERLDSDAAHIVGAVTWARGTTALAFTLVEPGGGIQAYTADFRSGPPVVSPLDAP